MNDYDLEKMFLACEMAMNGLFGLYKSDGIEEGSQLLTRDGRKVGNAHVSGPSQEKYGKTVWPILTDFGNEMLLTESEINELFYPPEWKFKLPVKYNHKRNDNA